MDANNRTRRIARGAAVGAVALFALYAVGVGLVLPPLARDTATARLGEALGRSVTIERVRVNPFTLAASIEGLRILEADRKTVFASFEALDLQASLKSLRHLAPVVDSAVMRGLRIHVVRDAETHYNLTDIVQRIAPPQRGDRSRPLHFSFSNIHVAGGQLDFEDRPMQARHEIRDIDLAIPFISSLPLHARELVKPAFSATANGAPLRFAGDTLPFESSLATHISLEAKAIDLRRYATYSPVPLPVTVDSGTLDATIRVRFQTSAKEPAFEIAGNAVVRDLACSTSESKPYARVGRVEVDLDQLRPLAQTLALAAVRVKDLEASADHVRIASSEARGIDVDLRARTVHAHDLVLANGDALLERGRDGSLRLASLPLPEAHPAQSGAWRASLGHLALSDFRVALVDHSVRPAVQHRVNIASVDADDLSNDHGASGKAKAMIAFDRGGRLDVGSTFTLEPFVLDASIDARGVDLVPYRAYVAQFPTVAVKKALASAKGSLRIHGTGPAMRVSYTGAAGITDLATFETTSDEDLLNWKGVAARDIQFDWGPRAKLAVTVKDVVVDRAYSRIIVHPDGKLNVQALRGGPDGALQPAAQSMPHDIRIDRIAFIDSRLNFTDHYVKPNYSADVGELEGTVSGLSSDPASRGNVDLRGRYDRTSPVLIAGTINPLAPELFLDIAAKGADIELRKLTAYSQR